MHWFVYSTRVSTAVELLNYQMLHKVWVCVRVCNIMQHVLEGDGDMCAGRRRKLRGSNNIIAERRLLQTRVWLSSEVGVRTANCVVP